MQNSRIFYHNIHAYISGLSPDSFTYIDQGNYFWDDGENLESRESKNKTSPLNLQAFYPLN